MASFRAASDLVTFLIANVTMANVAALTNRPVIRLAGGTDTSGDFDSGELVLDNEIMEPRAVNNSHRDERYTIIGTYNYQGTSETTFKEMLEEFDLTLMTENLTSDREYFYEVFYSWDTNIFGSTARINFTLTKQLVSITS